jgi:hypothetical protein
LAYLLSDRFASRYDAGTGYVRNELLYYAGQKLVPAETQTDSKNDGILACLAVRFALEFRQRTLDEQLIIRRQVERHMRICIAASPDLAYILTTASSEPFLAEAAAIFMRKHNTVRELAGHLEVSGIDRGYRGELAAMLIVMKACDEARVDGLSDEARVDDTNRVVSVLDFLETLFPHSLHEILRSAKPSNYREKESTDTVSLAATFEHAHMWFNHFIKVHDSKVLNVRFLTRLMARGAAVICPNNQEGIDLAIPILLNGTIIEESNTSVILIQVKNNAAIGTRVQRAIFDAMDPIKLGIFESKKEFKPTIRMVFAFGRPDSFSFVPGEPSIAVFGAGGRKWNKKRNETYDIWCSGISHRTFAVVSPEDIGYYKHILLRLPDINFAYELKDDPEFGGDEETKRSIVNLRRKVNPGLQAEKVSFSYTQEEGLWSVKRKREGS